MKSFSSSKLTFRTDVEGVGGDGAHRVVTVEPCGTLLALRLPHHILVVARVAQRGHARPGGAVVAAWAFVAAWVPDCLSLWAVVTCVRKI